MQDLIGYDEIIESAMRSVINETLKRVKKTGLKGGHYFVINFLTKFPGVVISKEKIEKYGDEMTIIIQHQYRDLKIEEDFFQISLSFAGKYETLVVPYKSVTSFSDPSMNFALKFSTNYSDEDFEFEDYDESNSVNGNNFSQKSKSDIDLSAKVISIDAFRNNNKK